MKINQLNLIKEHIGFYIFTFIQNLCNNSVTNTDYIKGKECKVVSLLFRHRIVKMHGGIGGATPCILNSSNKWKSVVSFKHWPLYPLGKETGGAPQLIWSSVCPVNVEKVRLSL
jgi:hypothetical protein